MKMSEFGGNINPGTLIRYHTSVSEYSYASLLYRLLYSIQTLVHRLISTPSMCKPSKIGHLEVIFGPMFSGKTSELIRRIRRYEMSNYKCAIVRYARDDRYSDSEIATHDGFKLKAISAMTLQDILSNISVYDAIGIDEGQFFPDIVEVCKYLLRENKLIVVAGLDGTFQRTGFGDILNIIPLAMKVDKLSAVCMSCGGKASFTRRLGSEMEVEVIGGADKYMAVCRECYKLNQLKVNEPFRNIICMNV